MAEREGRESEEPRRGAQGRGPTFRPPPGGRPAGGPAWEHAHPAPEHAHLPPPPPPGAPPSGPPQGGPGTNPPPTAGKAFRVRWGKSLGIGCSVLAGLLVLVAVGWTVLVGAVGDEFGDGRPAGVGEPAESGTFEFTVTAVEQGIETVGDRASGWTMDARGRYVFVTLSARNVGNAPAFFDATNARLIGDDGAEYASDGEAALYLQRNTSLYEEVHPGGVVTGKIVFDVPEGVRPEKLLISGYVTFQDPAVVLLGG